ncbi:MAG: DeoR/GlpR transcriptional regulator [Clostridia bacterium]|nr:DeoR/GlpR transcriptional regulator [Clostridia bacterium]
MKYNIEQRKAKILELLRTNGEVRVAELSRIFNISEVTVRFDLESLESQGLLTRVYGGAVSANKFYVDMDLHERYTTNAAEKKELAEQVAALVSDNDTLMLNAGTTITYILRAIKGRRNISIVTNSITNANEAAAYNGFNVILLGGSIDTKYQFTYGNDAIAQLNRYHASKAILSVDGVSDRSGLTLYYSNEVDIIRGMISLSDKVIIAADRHKIGRSTFAQIAPLESVHTLVTNPGADAEQMAAIRERNIEIVGG